MTGRSDTGRGEAGTGAKSRDVLNSQEFIDFRVRPPTPGYVSNPIYSIMANGTGIPLPRFSRLSEHHNSVQTRSMSTFLQEVGTTGLGRLAVVGRSAPDAASTISNQEIVETCSSGGSRFVPVAGLGPKDAIGSDKVLAGLRDDGFIGVSVDPGLWGLLADDAQLQLIYRSCASYGLVLCITSSQMLGSDLRYCHPDPIRRVAKEFPSLPVVVAHACWPWFALACAAAFECRNIYLMPDVYLAAKAPGWRVFVDSANTHLGEQVIYGSAYPLRPLHESLVENRDTGLEPEVLRSFLGSNAARLIADAST